MVSNVDPVTELTVAEIADVPVTAGAAVTSPLPVIAALLSDELQTALFVRSWFSPFSSPPVALN